ncbi:unnamed protein product [Polarella glacialis]|uniref:Ubiquitin-like domain-containing protein n=1 Tax=Polarella glacialis TaxID=89957 RepID=A0A813F9V8_POLGL|nr:unnamed protein product [Polarella glacialis]CAE8609594.1 unnamed protein product [Polarella glacialis]CAE8733431.1 unnamed protein product [Polarella glacialis]|mmetsp:Transcript_69427/g.111925  ORF Transcript_69427/g.111925 Transcript_69427/m.111925 type:complete len:101 (+) Transcript_69427:127-429(+)
MSVEDAKVTLTVNSVGGSALYGPEDATSSTSVQEATQHISVPEGSRVQYLLAERLLTGDELLRELANEGSLDLTALFQVKLLPMSIFFDDGYYVWYQSVA